MKLRIYENVTVGDLLNANLERDKADFGSYAPRFDASYIANHKTSIDEVRHMPQVLVKTGQNKMYTIGLYIKADSAQEPMRLLEGYVKHAGKLGLLDTPVENFGIHEVRTYTHSKDLEGLGGALEVLNQNIDNNKTVLLNEGLKQVDIDALIDLKNDIDAENVQQELNKEDRNILAKANEVLVAKVKEYNDDILDVGKRIYKDKDAAKYDDYVLEKIIARIRHEWSGDSDDDAPPTP